MSTPQPTPLGLAPSFGFGDRIGLATPGHIAAARRAGGGIAPMFAQQSIREMTRTNRTPPGVMEDAMNACRAAGWSQPHGADADHLKTPADVSVTAEAGFTFFTIDPSGIVDQQADDYSEARVRELFTEAAGAAPWVNGYRGKTVKLPTGSTIVFDEPALLKAAVKYGRAIEAAVSLATTIRQVQQAAGRDYEIELSVDETEQPTTLAEHYIVADQCLQSGMKLVSLAPRFIGELEKGVDYIGDVQALETSLRDHAAIAHVLGPYKLSLHSGSDKLSMYPALARATGGMFHVKTAGTSYLEALRVAAQEEPELFRELCVFSRTRYDADRATYHVHATLDAVPPPEHLKSDLELQECYLGRWETTPQGDGFTQAGRQILHCTFGSVLTDKRLGPALRACLVEHPAVYEEVLAVHFEKHLSALRAGM
ncbi:hypothetical protein Pla175_38500 [Pirellulimonas nuda]|uniref:Tagaturonate/fructuronate epimerase n=2 Tax=Pirellulimonas nuda TaxID=2528009 RepID=A0A518DG42_9BACT|nr:hypothetical protein Pla175_38500 [Pirellulimonas nuda]